MADEIELPIHHPSPSLATAPELRQRRPPSSAPSSPYVSIAPLRISRSMPAVYPHYSSQQSSPTIIDAAPTTSDVGAIRIVSINDPNQQNRSPKVKARASIYNLLSFLPLNLFQQNRFPSNKVKTSKYNLLSFFTLNLFQQIHNATSYIFFLSLMSFLNQIPQLAVYGRFIFIVPLTLVISTRAIKDAYRDLQCHHSDAKENKRRSMILHNNHYEERSWKSICVGDIVKVRLEEKVPCDMVLLGSSNLGGVAYVQTTILDGEIKLKTRYAHVETAVLINGEEAEELSTRLVGHVVCEGPNGNIHSFRGYLEMEDKKLALGPCNILLRGSELKRTTWAIGIAVYTGKDMKIMLNTTKSSSKSSKLEGLLKRGNLWLASFLVAMCGVCALGTGLWLTKYQQFLHFIPYYGSVGDSSFGGYYGIVGQAIFSFLSSVISFQTIVPLSLYLSMESV